MYEGLPVPKETALFKAIFSPYLWSVVFILGLSSAYLAWDSYKHQSPFLLLCFGLSSIILLMGCIMYSVAFITL